MTKTVLILVILPKKHKNNTIKTVVDMTKMNKSTIDMYMKWIEQIKNRFISIIYIKRISFWCDFCIFKFYLDEVNLEWSLRDLNFYYLLQWNVISSSITTFNFNWEYFLFLWKGLANPKTCIDDGKE